MMNEEPLLKFKGRLQLEDLKKMNRHRYHMRRKGYTLFYSSYFFLLFLFLYYGMDFSMLAVLLIILGGIVLGLVVGFSLLNRTLAKEYTRDPAAHSEFLYTVTESGIKMESERISHFLEWKDFSSAHEYPDMFILLTSPMKASPIPKTFFNSAEEIDTFRSLTQKITRQQ